MYQVIWIVEIWLGTRRSSAHANTAQVALSMCSSRYCSNFAPLFPYFWLSLFFWDSLTFSFYIFSSLWSTKEVTTENISLNKWKAWPMENSKDVLKIGKKLVTTKRGSFEQFLAKINFFEPGCFTFAPLFFIYFWSINIFWDSLTFSFYFFDIFLHLGQQKK